MMEDFKFFGGRWPYGLRKRDWKSRNIFFIVQKKPKVFL